MCEDSNQNKHAISEHYDIVLVSVKVEIAFAT